VQTDITSKDLRDFEEKRGEPQRFKLPAIGDTATKTGELTCQPILSRHYASMTQDGLQIAGNLGGGKGASFSLGRQSPARKRTLIPSILLRGTQGRRVEALRSFYIKYSCVVSFLPLTMYSAQCPLTFKLMCLCVVDMLPMCLKKKGTGRL